MTAAVVCLTALLAAFMLLHDRQVKQWAKERQILLERIQRPDLRPILDRPDPLEPLDTDADELALVGEILPEQED